MDNGQMNKAEKRRHERLQAEAENIKRMTDYGVRLMQGRMTADEVLQDDQLLREEKRLVLVSTGIAVAVGNRVSGQKRRDGGGQSKSRLIVPGR